MHKVFQRWVRVKEVFISRRLNKWGRRFGFVRFFEVRNVGRLEKELDQIYIGNLKLHVNVPRYRRNGVEDGREQRKEDLKQQLELPKETRKQSVVGLGVTGSSIKKEVWVEKARKKSFVEAVVGGSQQQWKGPVFKTHQQFLPWLEKSSIGQFNAELDFAHLEEEFVKGGMDMVRLRYMGDRLTLITPRVEESMKALFNLNKEWFDSIFDYIKPWSENHVADHKLVWVRCYGLPFSLWDEDCFAKVVGEMATLVSVDNSTLVWENLEFARLQVRILKNCNARLKKDMRINNKIYSIFIEEENPSAKGNPCKCSAYEFGSSDSVSSVDTYVEETELSVNSCEEEVERCDGGATWHKGEENEGGDQASQETKMSGSGESMTKGIVGRLKVC
ncbi:uncharacterized protein [Phaseolus vulgaris]|uniref:uncharacterized protein n=1 Tax=Phaseolus vulgaris TaxID=3885 RepID=UPI0035CA9547